MWRLMCKPFAYQSFRGLVMLSQPSDPYPCLRRMKVNQVEIVVRVELFRAWWKFFPIPKIGKRVCAFKSLRVLRSTKPEVALVIILRSTPLSSSACVVSSPPQQRHQFRSAFSSLAILGFSAFKSMGDS